MDKKKSQLQKMLKNIKNVGGTDVVMFCLDDYNKGSLTHQRECLELIGAYTESVCQEQAKKTADWAFNHCVVPDIKRLHDSIKSIGKEFKKKKSRQKLDDIL